VSVAEFPQRVQFTKDVAERELQMAPPFCPATFPSNVHPEKIAGELVL
jgi:hypothetical protein